jgi:hypothetical protein
LAVTTKVIEIDDSLGIILPEEMLERFKLTVGDTICLSEFSGGVELTPCDEQIETARGVMRENFDVLKRLAE